LVTEREKIKMSFYSALCEISGSLSPNGGGSANGHTSSSNGNGYGFQEAPYAWQAPENVEITEETRFSWFASPYNADDIGIAPLHKNEAESVVEVSKQLPPSFSYPGPLGPPSFSYPGPLGGAGPFGLLAPAVGSGKYEDYIVSQQVKEKEKYNAKTIGIGPLVKNDETTISEIGKQTEGTHRWEEFTAAVKQGYTREPEDVNVFEKSVSDAGKALTGVIDPTNYYLLAIAGGVLLLILIIK
jgi:hypothetical protein